MRFVNLTPNRITVLSKRDAPFVFMPDTTYPVPYVTVRHEVTEIDGVLVARSFLLGPVHNVPDPEEDVIFITSNRVAQVLGRPDVLSPDGGYRPLRDSQGRITATRRLQRFDIDL